MNGCYVSSMFFANFVNVDNMYLKRSMLLADRQINMELNEWPKFDETNFIKSLPDKISYLILST